MADIVSEYGGALCELAFDEGIENALLSEVRTIGGILRDNPAYISFLTSPNIPIQERLDAVGTAFATADKYVVNFIKLMTENGYAAEICDCFDEFERLYYEAKHISRADVISAMPLTDAQLKAIKEKLEKKTGHAVDVVTRISPELIGGVRVYIDGELLDGSVRGRIDAIREKLTDVTI